MIYLIFWICSINVFTSAAEKNVTWTYVLEMPGVTSDHEDAYFFNTFDIPPLEETAYIIEIIPHPNTTLHHMILSGCSTSTNCGQVIYAWAHGGAGLRYPPGVGLPIGPGSRIIKFEINAHYLSKVQYPDHSSITLVLTSQPQPRMAGVLLLMSSRGVIPPGQAHYPLSLSCRLPPGGSVTVMGVRTHAHSLGRSVVGYRVAAEGGSRAELLGRGNPQWPQTFYPLGGLSVPFSAIDVTDKHVLLARCVYDSQEKSTPTSIGSTHIDEMCNLYVLYHASPAGMLQRNDCVDDGMPRYWDLVPEDANDYAPSVAPPSPPDGVSILLSNRVGRIRPHFGSPRRLPLDYLRLGQVTSVATVPASPDFHLVVLHRGPNVWDANTFNEHDVYLGGNARIKVDTVFHLDPTTGQVKQQWGSGLFVLPHSVTVAYDPVGGTPTGVWITDVALHQVFKFDWGQWLKPSLTLGVPLQPGRSQNQFCKPTDVVISSSGDIFVSDGYCNSRIVKFSPNGTYLTEWPAAGLMPHPPAGERSEEMHSSPLGPATPDFRVVHSLTLIPPDTRGEEEEAAAGELNQVEQVCAADRENAAVLCYTTEGVLVARYAGDGMLPSVYAIEYSREHGLIIGVTGNDNSNSNGPHGFMLNPVALKSSANRAEGTDESQRIAGFFSMRGITNPHDLALAPSGGRIAYISQIGPNDVYQLALETDAHDTFASSSPLPTSLSRWVMRGRDFLYGLDFSRTIGFVLLLLVLVVALLVGIVQVYRLSSRHRRPQRQDPKHYRRNHGDSRWWCCPCASRAGRAHLEGFRPLMSTGDEDIDLDNEDDETEDVVLHRDQLRQLGASRRSSKTASEPTGNGTALSRVPLDHSTRPMVPTLRSTHDTCAA